MAKTGSSAPALERGIKLLDMLATNKDGFSFNEIFSKMDIPRASLFRILGKLKEYGYVYQEFTTNRYLLGFKIVDLSSIVLKKFDICARVRPFLQKLASQTEESAELVTLKEEKLFVLDRIDSLRPMSISVPIGRIYPFLHNIAHGMVFLAWMEEGRRKKRIGDELKQLYAASAPYEELNNELDRIHANGYAFREDGIASYPSSRFSSPVFDCAGKVIATMGVAVPPFRLKEDIGPKVREAAEQLSRQLGYTCTKMEPSLQNLG